MIRAWENLRFRAQGLGLRMPGSGLRIWDFGFKV